MAANTDISGKPVKGKDYTAELADLISRTSGGVRGGRATGGGVGRRKAREMRKQERRNQERKSTRESAQGPSWALF